MIELLERMIGRGFAHRVDGDILVPLDGTARMPHAILIAGGETTALGRALEVAIHAGQLPDPNVVEVAHRSAVEVRRRQVVALLILLAKADIVHLPSAPPARDGSALDVPWRPPDPDLRRPPTDAEVEAYAKAREAVLARAKVRR